MVWNGIEWNGMEWDGMEWDGMIPVHGTRYQVQQGSRSIVRDHTCNTAKSLSFCLVTLVPSGTIVDNCPCTNDTYVIWIEVQKQRFHHDNCFICKMPRENSYEKKSPFVRYSPQSND